MLALRSGTKFAGRFEIQAEAGSGGMGSVYRAVDLQTGELVALKVIRGASIADEARFAREAKALAGIRHPAVVRYVAHGTGEEGDPYLAMEWLEGHDLRERLAAEGLTIAEAVTLGLRAAEALGAVHAAGLLHRDIKPGNLFLTDGRVAEAKLIDFGLVHTETTGGLSLTRTGHAIGTPGYMAPEQARGDAAIDERVDLFALGCVLFRCLTGRAPFEGRHLMAVLTKVLLEEAPRAKSLRPEVPDALDELVARMLRKDPAERPASADEVAEALRALDALGADDETTPTPPSTALPRLTGEQRVTTVLLIGPGASAPDLDEVSRVEAVVREHQGRLDRVTTGARVVTIEGASAARDIAAQAARCALALRPLLPGVPMALATGWSESGAGVPVGEAIDRAARLLERRGADPGSGAIAVDDLTASLLDARFDVTEGAEEHILVGLCDLAPDARTLLGNATPFVGRDWELGSIQTLFDECVDDGSARALLLLGAEGMGKSRLVQEVVASVRRAHPDAEVWVGRGDPMGEGSAFGLLGQALRGACGIREGEPAEERRRKLAARVSRHLAPDAADRVVELVGELAGVPFPDEARPALRAARRDPELLGERMRRAWEDLLEAEGRAHPVLLVLEDLHWGDLPTVRFVGDALRSLDRVPWMVLASARPEVHRRFPRLWADRGLQELRLKPLPARAGERLARLVLGDAASDATIARVVGLAEGNAFYLEELIRAVDEARRRGAEGDTPLPATVLATVQARLDALSPGERRMLRAASVFGTSFWPGGVEALLGADSGSRPSSGWVDSLVARELVVLREQSRFAGEPELAFRHPLLREGAYATLTEADRALGHRLAGAWLEQRGEGDPRVLAHHFERGGDAVRAGAYGLRAAERALAGADTAAAVAYAERALALGLEGPLRIEALVLLADAQMWRTEWAAAGASAGEVLRTAPPGSAAWARAAAVKQGHDLATGHMDAFLATLREVSAIDPEPAALPLVLYALHGGMFVLCLGGQFLAARGVLARVEELAARIPLTDPIARARVHMCRQIVDALGGGDAWSALRHAEAAREAYEEAGDPTHTAWARLFVAIGLWSLGALEQARREMEALAAPSVSAPLVATTRDAHLGLLLVDAGALDEAASEAARLAEIGRSEYAFAAAKGAEAHWITAEIALRSGDPAAAEREAQAALEGLGTSPMFVHAVTTLLAAARLAAGRPADALAAIETVVALLDAQGGLGFRAARARLVHAEALLAAGMPERADTVLDDARARLLARAAAIGDEDLRRSFLASVPENARTLALANARLGPRDPGPSVAPGQIPSV